MYPANFPTPFSHSNTYPANFPAPGGGLIFFCLLFFHQGKKRRWGIRGKAPLDTRQKEGEAYAKFSDSSHRR